MVIEAACDREGRAALIYWRLPVAWLATLDGCWWLRRWFVLFYEGDSLAMVGLIAKGPFGRTPAGK